MIGGGMARGFGDWRYTAQVLYKATEELMKLYEETNQPKKAEVWKQKLTSLNETTPDDDSQ